MEEIKVSIIVPSYKRKKELFARAIESLLAGTYENIEIVVVDDNAKPEHAEYRQALSNYIAELNSDKVVYIQNETNLGGSGARNEGIRVATGEYITFLDDDDRYLKNKIKNQINFMLENNLDMCFTNLIILNGDDEVVDYREYAKIKQFDNQYLMKYHLTRQIAGTNTFMYKKECLLSIGGFVKVSMGQEYYLMYNTIESGAAIGYLDKNDTILYREGQECISSGPNKISGQLSLYEFKKSNFEKLNLRQRIYVRFRHHVVMAVAYKRNSKMGKCLLEVIIAGLTSPIDALIEFFGFFKKRKSVLLEEN